MSSIRLLNSDITDAQRAILENIPADVTRVKVMVKGKKRWKKIEEVTREHEIILNEYDEPLTMKGSPGRPKGRVRNYKKPGHVPVATPAPSKRERSLDLIQEQKSRHITRDRLVRLAKQNPESLDVLQQILVGLSEEAASLGFERLETERRGESAAQISTKRIAALKAIGDTWLRRKEQVSGTEGIDLDSPAFANLFKFIMNTFKEALAQAKVPPAQTQHIFSKFSKIVREDTWKEDAKKAYSSEN